MFIAIQLIISEPTRAIQHEFIVVNGITTSAFHKVA